MLVLNFQGFLLVKIILFCLGISVSQRGRKPKAFGVGRHRRNFCFNIECRSKRRFNVECRSKRRERNGPKRDADLHQRNDGLAEGRRFNSSNPERANRQSASSLEIF